jgi:N-acylneuraminate cytidylyltransferase
MTTVALIPARGGSKGLPEKNIKTIFGKPLIGWSIEQACASEAIENVYVSTNCSKIAEQSLRYGAKVPFLRPERISGSRSCTESAILHFCEESKKSGLEFDNIMLIQCTSPVRAHGRFDDAIKFFKNNKYDSILSVSESHRFHWSDPNSPKPLYDFKKRPRRQDINKKDLVYIETGSFYLFKKEKFLESKNRLSGSIGMYITPDNEMFDIDNFTDFSICEKLLSITSKEKNCAA